MLDGMGSWLCWKCSSNICQIYGSNYLSFIRNVYVSRIFDVVRFFWLFHYIHMTWAAGQYFSALQPLRMLLLVEMEKANIISGVLIQHHSNYTGQKKRRECRLCCCQQNGTELTLVWLFLLEVGGLELGRDPYMAQNGSSFFVPRVAPSLNFHIPKKVTNGLYQMPANSWWRYFLVCLLSYCNIFN